MSSVLTEMWYFVMACLTSASISNQQYAKDKFFSDKLIALPDWINA